MTPSNTLPRSIAAKLAEVANNPHEYAALVDLALIMEKGSASSLGLVVSNYKISNSQDSETQLTVDQEEQLVERLLYILPTHPRKAEILFAIGKARPSTIWMSLVLQLKTLVLILDDFSQRQCLIAIENSLSTERAAVTQEAFELVMYYLVQVEKLKNEEISSLASTISEELKLW